MRETDSWVQVPTPDALAALWRQQFGEGCVMPDLYRRLDGKPYQAMHTRDPIPGEEHLTPRHHISVAGVDDVPPWDVLANAGHEIRPGVPFCIGVPPKSWWINVHEFTIHLWECRDERLLDTWRGERRGDRPS